MSIAEKIIRAKNDYDEVYAKGVEVGKSQGGDTEETYNQGFEAGKKSEYDLFWDNYQNYGKPSCYKFAFAYNIFNDAIYNPKYPIITSGTESINSQDIFAYTFITDTKVDINITNNAGITRGFNQAKFLKTIRKLIVDKENTYNNTFDGCVALENIIIEGVIGNNFNISDSPLTVESLMSIIEHLKDYSGESGTTHTLTIGATNLGKLNDDQKAIATAKGWTLV
jgi:hypothetical protein